MDKVPVMANDKADEKILKVERFVHYVITRAQEDNGFSARLKRADNPATEYQSWEFLAKFHIDLEKTWERLPYCTVGAAIARAQPTENGQLPLGEAIAACFEEGLRGEPPKPANARLRRLLACTTTAEACAIVRPLLALMASRGITPDFSLLLKQLLGYGGVQQVRIRAHWAQTFYRCYQEEESRHD